MATSVRVDIQTANDADDEKKAAGELHRLLYGDGGGGDDEDGGLDLDRYLYTTLVCIDERAPISHSHPVLTLQPAHVLTDRRIAVTTFVHEQMHWASFVLPGVRAATDEVRQRWPEPPAHDSGGARDAHSTWLHFPVCALELESAATILGPDDAHDVAAQVPWYRWIYDRLLGDDLPYRDYLDRHGIALPDVPPTRLPVVDALRSAEAATDDPNDLRSLIEAHLERWLFRGAVDPDTVRAALPDDAFEPWAAADIDPTLLTRILVLTVVAVAALDRLVGRDRTTALGRAHRRNADVYEHAIARPDLFDAIGSAAPQIAGAQAIVDWATHG